MRIGRKHLTLVLWLFALHTFAVGLGLILVPSAWMEYFGLVGYQGRFFQVQGGVFHLIMGIFYLTPIWHWGVSRLLVHMFIVVKILATVFLFLYFLLVEPAIVILLSGVGDGLLALMLWWVFRNCPPGERPGPSETMLSQGVIN
ncbi:MAG: hypothetical protein ISR91_01400 [Candidatus Delongbacteria bacterium]|nr:hypothetical protein [bacterium]MBL7032776.1 hypothetical protein [Candidatus Delongbacteria bacterium]